MRSTRYAVTFVSFLVFLTHSLHAAPPTTAPATHPALPFEKEIEAFEAQDKKAAPPQAAILFLGSSSVRFWTSVAKDFPDQKVINRGFGGSTIPDSTRYAERIVFPYHPSQIVFYAGDNDIAGGHAPDRVLADFKALVEKLRTNLPEVRIHFIAIKPSLARWKLVDKIKEANRLIEEYCKAGKGLDYIDVFTPMLGEDGKPKPEIFREDGLHMNAKGYEIWTGIIGPRIAK